MIALCQYCLFYRKEYDNVTMNSTTHKQHSANTWKTWFFLLTFSLLVGAIGFWLANYFNNRLFFWLGSLFSISMSVWSYWFSDKMVLKMANARPLKENENGDLKNMVQKLASSASLPMPKIYIIDDPSPNAFATGRNPENSAIAFTTGILSLLDKSELEGVAAHELSHVMNRDTLLMTIVAVVANLVQTAANMMYYFSPSNSQENKNLILSIATTLMIMILAPLAATIIQLAVSRRREFAADASGAELTNYPKALASALEKISKFPFGMQNLNPSISHLFISEPEKNGFSVAGKTKVTSWFKKLFMTHPPTEERIEALLAIR